MKKNTEATKIERLKKTVAELRQTIRSLKRSNEAQLRQIGENLPEGGFYQMVHNPDGRRYCPYVSDSFERLFQVKTDLIKKAPQVQSWMATRPIFGESRSGAAVKPTHLICATGVIGTACQEAELGNASDSARTRSRTGFPLFCVVRQDPSRLYD